MTDIEIARNTELKPIREISHQLEIKEDELEQYGKYKAKINQKVIDYDEKRDLSTVKIKLYTGRHHQIRAQFANFGHSLYGDQKYGVRGKGKQIRLWAYELTFEHPVKKDRMTFKSIPPFINEEYVKL